MLSSKDIRNVKFSKSVGGYKQEEVDILLDKIEVDYDQFDRQVAELNAKIEQLEAEVENCRSSQASIQNVLLSAQKLADQIVAEAKEKSEQIIKNAEANIELVTAREKELSEAFDRKATERKAALNRDIEASLETAKVRSESIDKATADSVARQQLLFDKLKLEVSAFKAEITKRYKEHLEILQKLPDEVPMDPTKIASAVADAIDKAPDVQKYIDLPSAEKIEADVAEAVVSVKEPDEEPAVAPAAPVAPASEQSGFVVNPIDEPEED